MSDTLAIHQGDVMEKLALIPDESVQCCVTSPPYWGLRDYGIDGQIGLEPTLVDFVQKMVEVFQQVRRVLKNDGTCFINLGDTYAGSGGTGLQGLNGLRAGRRYTAKNLIGNSSSKTGLKQKDLCGVPWRVAFALQDDGWYLRQDIIWHKPNPMPESVRDRCTKAHEYLFLLSKSPRYYWDAEAMTERVSGTAHRRASIKAPVGWDTSKGSGGHGRFHKKGRRPGVTPKSAKPNSGVNANESFSAAVVDLVETRNRRSVWTIETQAYPEAHFATFPEQLPKLCIMAGSRPGDTILDPFAGSGTTGAAALELGRKTILIELNPEYIQQIEKRTHVTPGMF